MKADQAVFRIAVMCRLLGVSTSGYYAWRNRCPSTRTKEDTALTQEIRAYHQASKCTYGMPRIHADLVQAGIRVGRKRVARLMRAASLQGVSRRKGPRTTVRRPEARPAPDLVDRDFTASAPPADSTLTTTSSSSTVLHLTRLGAPHTVVGVVYDYNS